MPFNPFSTSSSILTAPNAGWYRACVFFGPTKPKSPVEELGMDAVRLSLSNSRMHVALVSVLLASVGPNAILGRIGSIVVAPLKRMSFRARPHVSKELRGIIGPIFDHSNSSRSVVAKTGIAGIGASLLSGIVRFELRRDRTPASLAMANLDGPNALVSQASAGKRATGHHLIDKEYLFSAAHAPASRLPVTARRQNINNGQAVKCLADDAAEVFSHRATMGRAAGECNIFGGIKAWHPC